MDEAIDLAIEGRSPYPEKAAFIDADEPGAGHAIERAADQGLSVVLVSADGSTRILNPQLSIAHIAGPRQVRAKCHRLSSWLGRTACAAGLPSAGHT